MDRSSHGKVPTASQLRKSNKPLMEKRRRARINNCLGQLKSLVVDAMKTENTKCSKLEKADILELTVKHLRSIQRQQLTDAASNADPATFTRYVAGFNECAAEITRFLSLDNGLALDVRTKLLNHLASSLQKTSSKTIATATATTPCTTIKSEPISRTPSPTMGEPIYFQIPALPTGAMVAPATAHGQTSTSGMVAPQMFMNASAAVVNDPSYLTPSHVNFNYTGHTGRAHCPVQRFSDGVAPTITSPAVAASSPRPRPGTSQFNFSNTSFPLHGAEAPTPELLGHQSPVKIRCNGLNPRQLEMERNVQEAGQNGMGGDNMWRPW